MLPNPTCKIIEKEKHLKFRTVWVLDFYGFEQCVGVSFLICAHSPRTVPYN